MMDYPNWRKKPAMPAYVQYLRQHRLDPDDEDEDLTLPLAQINTTAAAAALPSSSSAAAIVTTKGTEVKISGLGVTPVAVSTSLPAAVAQLNQQGLFFFFGF